MSVRTKRRRHLVSCLLSLFVMLVSMPHAAEAAQAESDVNESGALFKPRLLTPDTVDQLVAEGDNESLKAMVEPISEQEVTLLLRSLPQTEDLPLVSRTVAAVDGLLYVADIHLGTREAVTKLVSIPRSGAAPTELVTARATVDESGTLSGKATSVSGTVSNSTTPSLAGECDQCTLAGFVVGLAYEAALLGAGVGKYCGPIAAKCILAAGLGTFAAGLFGVGVGEVCELTQCPGAQPSAVIVSAICSFDDCDLRVRVKSSGTRTLTRMSSIAYWEYPLDSRALLSDGTLEGSWQNQVLVVQPLDLVQDLGAAGQLYDLHHESNEPAWTRCASAAGLFASATFSDGTTVISQYMHEEKPHEFTCPGYVLGPPPPPPTLSPSAQVTNSSGAASWSVKAQRSSWRSTTLRFDFGDGTEETRTIPQGSGDATFVFNHTFTGMSQAAATDLSSSSLAANETLSTPSGTGTYIQMATVEGNDVGAQAVSSLQQLDPRQGVQEMVDFVLREAGELITVDTRYICIGFGCNRGDGTGEHDDADGGIVIFGICLSDGSGTT